MKTKKKVSAHLINELGAEMHFALLGMQLGTPCSINWVRVAKVLVVISVAADRTTHRVKRSLKDKVNVALEILADMADRRPPGQEWTAEVGELRDLADGILAAESILPRLDYPTLQLAYTTVGHLTHPQ